MNIGASEPGCIFCNEAVPERTVGSLALGVAPWRGESDAIEFYAQFTAWAHHACLLRVSNVPDDILEVDWEEDS